MKASLDMIAGESKAFTLKDGKLILKQGSNELPIRKVGGNRFSATRPGNSTPMEFTLVPGADGKAEYFHAGLRAAKRIRE